MSLQVANLDTAGEKHSFDHGELHIVTLGDAMICRGVLNPGWRWSDDVKPYAGTESCQVAHCALVLSGRFHVRMDDGREVDLGPGDAHVVGPGHDAWVVGDEQCVIVDIGPAPARPNDGAEQVVRAYFDAFSAQRVDDMLALFTDDATVMADGFPTASGKDQLRSTYEAAFAALEIRAEPTIERVLQAGDTAFVRSSGVGSATVRATGETNPVSDRELFGLRRTATGWQISDYVFNTTPKAE